MWKIKGFNAAYNAIVVERKADSYGFGEFFNSIPNPQRYFYAKGKSEEHRQEAMKKAEAWVAKQ